MGLRYLSVRDGESSEVTVTFRDGLLVGETVELDTRRRVHESRFTKRNSVDNFCEGPGVRVSVQRMHLLNYVR